METSRWCEENGLKDQAIAHYHAVLRRDPTRDAAWTRLGFKKVGGRWVKPEWLAARKQESDQQGRANKHWKTSLEKWNAGLASRDQSRRAEAEKGLEEVADPRAVPAIWAVFVTGARRTRNAPCDSWARSIRRARRGRLAMLALMSPKAEVRQEATQLLRRRDPRDFAPLLIGLPPDKIEYEVKPVNGPGSTGQLVIKNPDVNVTAPLLAPASAQFRLAAWRLLLPRTPGDFP